MKIDHIAIWSRDLESLKMFYIKYFGATHGEKYTNVKKSFQSYFLSFKDGCRLEIMQMPGILSSPNSKETQHTGLIHLAISVGDKHAVDSLTAQLKQDGYHVIGEPRTTGDGYYESIVLDPDGNRIEITV